MHPAASAGATLQTIWFMGQFHGVMSPHTPTGSFRISVDPLSSSNSKVLEDLHDFQSNAPGQRVPALFAPASTERPFPGKSCRPSRPSSTDKPRIRRRSSKRVSRTRFGIRPEGASGRSPQRDQHPRVSQRDHCDRLFASGVVDLKVAGCGWIGPLSINVKLSAVLHNFPESCPRAVPTIGFGMTRR